MSKGAREQPCWNERERFIDRLVAAEFTIMGGPLVDEGGVLLIVDAASEADVRGTLRDDP